MPLGAAARFRVNRSVVLGLVLLVFVTPSERAAAQPTFYRSYEYDVIHASAECLLQMADGGYLLVGVEVVDDSLTLARSNGVLLRTDESGELLWRRTYMGPEGQMLDFRHAIITGDGSIAITGVTIETTPPYAGDLWCALLDEEGELLWSANVDRTSDQCGIQVREVPGGGYAVGGWSDMPSVAQNAYGAYLVRFSPVGDTLWTRTYSAPPPYGSSLGYCLETTADTGFIFAGARNYDSPLVIRLDSMGDTLWMRLLDTLNFGRAHDVLLTEDGNIAITGYGTVTGFSRPFLTMLDPNGNMLWLQTYPEVLPGWAYAMDRTPYGYVLGGMTANYKFRIMATDFNGELLWTHTIEPTETYGDGYDVIHTSDGGFALCGLHGSTVAHMVLIKTDQYGLITNTAPDDPMPPGPPIYLFPNPAGDVVAASYTLAYASQASIRLLDMNGRLVAQLSPAAAQARGEHRMSLDLAGIPAGCYLVEVAAERESWTARLIKQ